MVKKRWQCGLIVVVMFLFPNLVFASEVSLSCTDEVLSGGQVDCFVYLNADVTIKGMQANLGLDGVFSYVSGTVGDDWEKLAVNSVGMAVVNTDGIVGNSVLGKFSLVLSDSAEIGKKYTVKLTNVILSDGSSDIPLNDVEATVTVISVASFVESISINGVNLELKDGVTNYTYQVQNNVSSVDLSANLSNANYSFSEGYGSRTIGDLKIGDNIVYLKIRNTDKELLTYTINIQRLEKSSEEVIVNPKTGNVEIIIVGIIMALSLGMVMFYRRKINRVNAV